MADKVRARLRQMRERTAGVRFRATAGAVLVVGVALVIAGAAMVLLLRRSLTENVTNAARLKAETVTDLVGAGALDRLRTGSDDEFVQVLGPSGEVIAATRNLAGAAPLVELLPGESKRVDVPFDDDPFIVVAVSASGPEGNYRVLAGRTLDSVVESIAVVTTLLVAGIPLLLLVIAGVTWGVVGQALAPVEAIRSEVNKISSGELRRRVPLPVSSDEIARLAATMNQMLDRLEQGQARQRRFVSDASHELRSPVATIRQHAELALARPADTPPHDLARTVLDENLRLQRLVENLLLLAHMDEHGSGGVRQLIDLDDVVFEEIDRVRQVTDRTVDAARVSGGRVLGDRRQLSRLVGNLLENAVRHAHSRVAVALHSDGDQVILSVDDDGGGIPDEERERVFERFVRLDEARDRDSGGTGLGLAIVAQVAAGHEGSAGLVDSTLGGARFEIRLPGVSD